MAAGKKTGGRQRGTPNKRTVAKSQERAAVLEAGLTPLEYMLGVMRDPAADRERRDEMARAAAPYVHPRMASIDVQANVQQHVIADKPMTAEEWAAEFASDERGRSTAH